MLQLFVMNARLQYENDKLRRENADMKAMNWAFTSDTEHKINKLIHAIKCRDEIPNNIFLGKKEWDAIKAIARNPMYTGPSNAIDGRYMGFKVIKVDKATFVDVSTVP